MAPARVPPLDGVAETILYADDLDRAACFYREVMGLKQMVSHGDRLQGFDLGDGRALLLFKRGGTLTPHPVPTGGVIPPHDGQGPHHIAFAIGAPSYEAWKSWLTAKGVIVESETHWERGGRSLYFRDPDNHLVELVTPGIWPNY